MIADHGLCQHDLDLPQVVLDPRSFRRRQRFVGFALREKHVPRGKFGVVGQDDLLRRKPVGKRIPNDLLEEFMREVVGEIEIGHVVSND